MVLSHLHATAATALGLLVGEVGKRFENALPLETVERPKEQDVELALGCFLPHSLKSAAVGFPAGLRINVIIDDLPAMSVAVLL